MRIKSKQFFLMEKYYRMFFLTTNILIGKYYPNLFTQFIIGCACYILSFLIIKDIITLDNYKQYKYHVLCLIVIDTSYLIYLTNRKRHVQNINTQYEKIEPNQKLENISTDLKTGSMPSITLSSEINDVRITHDLSLSDNQKNSIFSTSDEKPQEEDKPAEKLNIMTNSVKDNTSETILSTISLSALSNNTSQNSETDAQK